MTTTVLIINRGPQPISVETNTDIGEIVQPRQFTERYVYSQQDIVVKEVYKSEEL